MNERPSAAISKGIPALDPFIGRVIGGRFKVTALLARGGMGKVYRAEQAPLGRICAIKVLNPGYAGEQDPEFHKRFFLEASVVSKLTHPNTVTIFDYGRTDDDIYYMAMEYLEGQTLHRAIRDAGHLPEERAAHIARQICRALREAHALGVIHRDLKPANIFLARHGDESDFVKVLDFGLVKSVADKGEELTQTGMFMGSPKYMAPEQIRGDRVDARTDVYALGIILYEMLTGKVPFDRATSVHILMAHVHEEAPPIREMNPRAYLSVAMERAVAGCMAKDPERRLRSMEDVLTALKTVGVVTATVPAGGGAIGEQSSLLGAEFASAPVDAPQSIEALSRRSRPNATPSSALPRLLPPPGSRSSNGTRAMAVAAAFVVAGAIAYVAIRPSRPSVATATVAANAAPTPTSPAAAAGGSLVGPAATSPVAPAAAPVKIRVNTEPDGASVKENGVEVCNATPCDVFYKGADGDPEREHNLTLTRQGYRVETRSVKTTDLAVNVKLTLASRAWAPPLPPRAADPPAVPTGYKTDIPY